MQTPAPIHVTGSEQAGTEATWQIAQAGVPVVLLHEETKKGAPSLRWRTFFQVTIRGLFILSKSLHQPALEW
ncbi:hypothetical protein IQ273_04495 [Nodosilinea sp. LEGE 07298]|uniref:hypothetical protein n=1 Tax=Nodosilinea sp. LEGE 07298 TaxID=2777970 RepID=UPI001881B5F7|nr:hypothetical protein [Nodosilinea sp. LEGE 07298]MBE9108675.1 hypothetical protein [Nodosilinea sp. LEGE 07298]